MSGTGLFYHETVPATVRIAQCVGITTSGFVTGSIGTFSYGFIPALMAAPAPLLARQWKIAYNKGKALMPPMAVLSGLLYGYLAYQEPIHSSSFKLYTAAAILVPAIAPYTLTVMAPTNNKLGQKAEQFAFTALDDKAAEIGVKKEETVHALADKWATLNLVRCLIALTGTVCGVWATLNKVDVVGASARVGTGANRM